MNNAAGCIVVCDIMNENSLDNSLMWKQVLLEHCTAQKSMPIFLAQNKVDLYEESLDKQAYQSEDRFRAFVTDHNFNSGYRTSAKTRMNLDLLFEDLVDEILINNP